MSRGFIFLLPPHCTVYAMWLYVHLTIHMLWGVVMGGTVVFLPVLVIFDITWKVFKHQANNLHNFVSYVV